ncbi:hypothetical protein FLK97_18095 [Salmonella enterica]|nr:hypothetical protein [Salmonella enterica]EBG1336165.1 hypothetical protein [Salmonella enterica]ECD8518504.1 hypothetical protein [Salmonella enterica]ECK6780687.1 hypothetical protein [Salmonella enterica]EJD3338576.1 hypothetical protein [Salmonella enterica]
MKYFYFISVLLLSFNAFSGQLPVPRVTGTSGSGGAHYHVYISYTITDVGPSADVIPPKGQTVGLLYVFKNLGIEGYTDPYTRYYMSKADGIKTVSELAMEIYDNYASSMGEFDITTSPDDMNCVGWGYGNINDPEYDVPIGTDTIVGGCAPIPPPGFSCSIDSQNIELDHHSLARQIVNGDSVSTAINVSCDSETAVKFSLSTDLDYIEIFPSGTSELFVNDLPLNSKIELPAGSSTVKLSDKLSGVTETGVNSGSSVLVIEPY